MVNLKYPEPKFFYIYREFYKGVPNKGYLQISGFDSSSNPFALYKSIIVWVFEVKTKTIRLQPLIQDILVVLLSTSLFYLSLVAHYLFRFSPNFKLRCLQCTERWLSIKQWCFRRLTQSSVSNTCLLVRDPYGFVLKRAMQGAAILVCPRGLSSCVRRKRQPKHGFGSAHVVVSPHFLKVP